MKLLLTVGTTRFDALVAIVTTIEFIAAAHNKGYTEITIQHGHSPLPEQVKFDSSIQCVPFIDDLPSKFTSFDLVVSHAGSGTILDILRPINNSKAIPKLIVVPNEGLMDNHQWELANAIQEREWAQVSSINNFLHSFIKMDHQKDDLLKQMPTPCHTNLNTILRQMLSTSK